MNYRDWLQQVIYKIINPVVRGMIKIGITPNFITTTGLILNIVAAGIFIYAGLVTDSEEDLSLVGWTGGLILFAGLFDMMDGRVARLGNMSSTFGALYDSVLDRYSELFTLFGISYYLPTRAGKAQKPCTPAQVWRNERRQQPMRLIGSKKTTSGPFRTSAS